MIVPLTESIKAVFTDDGFAASNSMYVDDDAQLVIDSAAGKLLDEVNPGHVDLLLNSHHHIDHVRGNDLFTRARILIHAEEHASMRNPEKMLASGGWSELMEGTLEEHARSLGGLPDRLYSPWRVDGEFRDGQVFDCGHTKVQVMHMPGHTAGHCAFYFPEEGILFSADICLTAAGPWYGEEHADIDAFINSIQRIIALRPSKIVTGHWRTVIDLDVTSRLEEYRDRILAREAAIKRMIETGPRSIADIAEHKIIYKSHPISFVMFWERYMIKKHLEHLAAAGLADRMADGRWTAGSGRMVLHSA
jgi:glyoxylase-like metal-dependent hydrolase (beta-lactamase superfamily II)